MKSKLTGAVEVSLRRLILMQLITPGLKSCLGLLILSKSTIDVMLTSAYGRVEWLNYGPLKDDKTHDLLSTLVVVQASPTDW